MHTLYRLLGLEVEEVSGFTSVLILGVVLGGSKQHVEVSSQIDDRALYWYRGDQKNEMLIDGPDVFQVERRSSAMRYLSRGKGSEIVRFTGLWRE